MHEPLPAGLAAAAAPPPRGVDGRALLASARALALAGGAVFIGLVMMSIVSIVGRKVASAPVPGDVELLQMCTAFASASFFAWCHLNHGDVKVDFSPTTCVPARCNGWTVSARCGWACLAR